MSKKKTDGKPEGTVQVIDEEETEEPTPKAALSTPAALAARKGEDGLTDREREFYRRQRSARAVQVAAGRYRVRPMTEGTREALEEAIKAL